ncbi:hypothetical protein L1987_32919 [Smallanthus sonchifolius]|uniref:Uncharacterized protein n=1 Tax=Smallanthus sonchifolius TaxID=185202 RepID=A0ACB9HQT3_9ASTR|nr:hypothetical protein L1987_32919 [Smallanthus sonchifolius]
MVFGWERTGITPANRGDLGGVVGMSRARKKDRECDSLGSNTMAKAEGGGELHSGGLRWCLRLPSIWSSLSSDEILRQQATCSCEGLDGDSRKDEEDGASSTVVVVKWWWCNGSPMVVSFMMVIQTVVNGGLRKDWDGDSGVRR